VRSHEELLIANWLFMNGVAYEYERPYEHDTATKSRRQYKPDFYLPNARIYVEHFGIDRKGATAPFVDAAAYTEGMRWKRDTHERYGTTLVETYSYHRMEGTLFSELKTRLEAVGVRLSPRRAEQVLAAADKQNLTDPAARLMTTFLGLFKGNAWSLEEVEAAASSKGRANADPARTAAFLRVFRLIRQRYEDVLVTAGEIDFNDMITQAAERVRTGAYRSPFSRIIIDEFQDLSRGRGQLLRALMAQQEDPRLFCVGDDWQSIYRFTGSDIGQMTSFSEEFATFGTTLRCDLTKTHRFGRELLEASSQFIQANPQQLRKSLRSLPSRDLGRPAVLIRVAEPVSRGPLTPGAGLLEETLAEIEASDASDDERITVLILGRYRHTLPEDHRAIARRHPRLELYWMTVHTSKGLEADYVIVLDVTSGRLGFPNEIADDPVLDLVLAEKGSFEHAEERRVFYVALTRSRTRSYVLTEAGRASRFVTELLDEKYRAWVSPPPSVTGGAPACWLCGGGVLVPRTSSHGPFWGCSNYPICEATTRYCDSCGRGAMVPELGGSTCSVAACGHRRWKRSSVTGTRRRRHRR
jgi:DNA helicase-4